MDQKTLIDSLRVAQDIAMALAIKNMDAGKYSPKGEVYNIAANQLQAMRWEIAEIMEDTL